MADLAAFVLAGGRSARMGADKAFLQLNGRTLLQRALELAGTVARDVRVVGSREKFAALAPVVEDVYGERGPLGGIHAALSATGSEFNLILAVDLPFVQERFLAWLAEQAQTASAVVTVPRAGGRLQPLCGIYRREFGEIAERALAAGRNKIDTLFRETKVRIIEEDELAHFAFPATMFDNLNTPQEWEQAGRRLQQK